MTGESRILAALRASTREEHQRIEHALDLMRPSHETVVHSFRIHRVTAGLSGIPPPLGAANSRHAGSGNAGLCRSTDEARLGGDGPGQFPVTWLHLESKDQPRLPSLETPAQALGSMYVLEGSSLGGQILSRHFEKTLGVRPDSGCRYLSAYGSDTGVMWKIFCEVLESRPTAEVPQMTLAAVETFQILHECLLSGVSAGCLLPSLPATSKEPGPHASI